MKTKKASKQYLVPATLQKLFIFSALGFFLVQTLTQLYQVFFQYADYTNLSSFYWYFTFTSVVPFLFFLIPFLLNPKRGFFRLPVVFENFLIGVTGITFFLMASTVLNQLKFTFNWFGHATWDWMIPDIILAGCSVLLYIFVQSYLRHTNRWRA